MDTLGILENLGVSNQYERPQRVEVFELQKLGYSYSEPHGEWDYPHIIGHGGVFPYYPGLIEELKVEHQTANQSTPPTD